MGNTLNTLIFSALSVSSPLPPHSSPHLSFATSTLVFLSLLSLIYASYKFHELIYVVLIIGIPCDRSHLFISMFIVCFKLYFGFPQSCFSDLCLFLLNPVQQYSMPTIIGLWKYFLLLYSKVIRPFHWLKYSLFANFCFLFVNFLLNSPF